MGFSFSATAQCDLCGEYLSASDEECDHGGKIVAEQMFRSMIEDTIISVKACRGWQWQSLEERVGDEWIGYVWLGSKDHVKNMTSGPVWNSVEEIPYRAMSTDAPDGVGEGE